MTIVSRMLIVTSFIALASGLAFGFEIAVLVIALFGWALVLLFLRSPKVGVFGLVVLCAVDPTMRVYVFLPLDLPHNTFNYLLLIIMLSSLMTLWRHMDVRIALMGCFASLLAVQILGSPSMFLGLHSTFEVVAGFGLIAAFFRTGLDDRFLGRAAVSVGIAVGCLMLVYFQRPPDVPINVNAIVHVPLGGLVLIALAVARRGHRNWTLIGLLVTVLFGCAFITTSRGGFMVAAVLSLFVLWRAPSFRWKSYSIATACLALVVAAVVYGDLFSRSTAKWAEFTDPALSVAQSTHRRSEIAESGWRTFLANPLGTGTGSFVVTNGANRLHSRGYAAHSAWIKTMTENGIPGLLLLAAFVIAIALGRPASPDVSRAIGPVAALAMSLLFLTSEFQSKSLWMLIAGAILLIQQRQPRASRTVRAPAASGMRGAVIRPRGQAVR